MTIMSTLKAVKVELNTEENGIFFEVTFEFSSKGKGWNKNGMKIISGKLTTAGIRNCDLHCK